MTEMNEEIVESVQEEAPRPLTLADLPESLQQAAARMQWTDLMPVQKQAIPHMLAGRDIMVQSKTGSGKTGAFLLPILNRIDGNLGAPQALVLVPTRELAVQVSREAEELGREIGVRSLSIYGGVGYKAQMQGLEQGAQLIIGTPGRILDHLLKGTLSLDLLKMLVFDEADRMLSMGFYPDMKQLQRYLPRGLQSAMFSATYPGHVKRLAQQFLKDPLFVSLSQDQVHASDVMHVVYKVPAMQKSRILVKIIEQENPASGIIFCNTKADVHFVAVVLRRFGYDVGEISADLSQAAREDVLEKLRLNKLKFLVATDVAARGIDIHELSHVFQYQPPQDHEAYVHRTGRTGRAGAAGVAISFVSGMEEIELEQIAKKFSIDLIEREVPADEELETLISQRAVFLLEAKLRSADNIQKERLQRFLRTVGELATNEDSQALLAMLIDEFYQKTFHAPLEQPVEKLPEITRSISAPAPVQAASEEVRPVGEKKKRRRNRKKPGSTRPLDSTSQDVTSPEELDVPVAPSESAPAPRREERPRRERPARPVQEPRPSDGDGPVFPAAQQVTVATEAVAADASVEQNAQAVADAPIQNGALDGESPNPPAKKRRRRRPRKPGPKPEANGNEMTADQPAAEKVERSAENNSPRPPKPAPKKQPVPAPEAPARPRKKIFLE